MRKAQKKQAEEFLELLEQAHDEISKSIQEGNIDSAKNLLVQCQEGAINLGNLIEKSEGEGFKTIPILEEYCELTYQLHEKIRNDNNLKGHDIYAMLRKLLIQIENSVKNDIKIRYEIVFLPYKASMWDSLESVWKAANADPDCDAYVVPIPYYDRNRDGTLGTYHYEGNDMPKNVPITYYDSYHIENRRPDVIYIHNPYDEGNYVTSVEPRYYSSELKKYTEMLVYIPYYVATGDMSEGQAMCQAYNNADYIITQAERYSQYFDASIPREKLVPLGSPKLDRVLELCESHQEPPEAWKSKIKGRQVYFYNTSIGGMLCDTKAFLEKLRYVFSCFRGREGVCLLWRPHPLLESTFASMRPELYPHYMQLKQEFIETNIGIYDDTTDIEKSIALSDVYIGDSGTSVTALFGIAGKPLFILNNRINISPMGDDWKGDLIKGFYPNGCDWWLVTWENKLFYSKLHNYHYEYFCDLSEYNFGRSYNKVIEYDGNAYVCPDRAQNILVISEQRVVRKVELKRENHRAGAFVDSCRIGEYLFLIPNYYPAIVRYDMKNERIDYIKGYNPIFANNERGQRWVVGACVWNQYLLIASPTDQRVLAIDSRTMEVQLLTTGAKNRCGAVRLIPNKEEVWLLPAVGTVVTRWNPKTGKVEEYDGVPDTFRIIDKTYQYNGKALPFSSAAFDKNRVILAPHFGNMFVSININTREMEEWKPLHQMNFSEKNGYFSCGYRGRFLYRTDTLGKETWRFYCGTERCMYDINVETRECKKIEIKLDKKDIQRNGFGFGLMSETLPYACCENAVNSLGDFLDGFILKNSYNREIQLQAYSKITANHDGTSGKRIHEFVRTKI